MPGLATRRRAVGATTESTIGDKSTLSASDAAINAFEPDFSPNIDFNERPAPAAFGNLDGRSGARAGGASFSTELSPDAGSSWANSLLPACGFKDSSGVWSLTSNPSDYTTSTIGLFQAGWLYSVFGAQGNLSIEGNVGERVMCNFEFTGKWSGATKTMVDPDLPDEDVPVLMGATLTIGGQTYLISTVSINLNNEVQLRQDATDETGYKAAMITQRRVTISVDPEADTSKDWFADWFGVAPTEASFQLQLSGSGGTPATVSVDAPALQLTNVNPGDRDGIHVHQLEFQANQDTGADDELSITFA